MAWNVWIVDTMTGLNRLRVKPSSMSWGRAINGGAGGQATFQLNDPVTKALDLKTWTQPLLKTLVIDWDGVAIYAGVIWVRKYLKTTGELQITHNDFWSLFRLRLLMAATTTNLATATLSYTSSLEGMAQTLVEACTTGRAGNFALPIIFPGSNPGTNKRTFYGYNLPTLQDALDSLMVANGGTDIDFNPHWTTDGKLQLIMRTGDLAGDTIEMNTSGTTPAAFDVTRTDDANKVANFMLAAGEGSEKKMKIGAAFNAASPYPALEDVISFKDEKDDAVLDGKAQEQLNIRSVPTTQWEASLPVNGDPSVAKISIGGTAKLYLKDDPWIPDGWYSNRIIGFSGDLGNTAKMSFQEIGVG